jgi:cell division inhibitor SulA
MWLKENAIIIPRISQMKQKKNTNTLALTVESLHIIIGSCLAINTLIIKRT